MIVIRTLLLLTVGFMPLCFGEDDRSPVTPESDISYLDNGIIKVGADLNRGGSIGFLALTFKSVDESIAIWRKLNECPDALTITEFPDKQDDGTRVTKKCYGPRKDGAEVVLIEIDGGGHTWPGQKAPISLIGKSTLDISANDMMWEFFVKHPIK